MPRLIKGRALAANALTVAANSTTTVTANTLNFVNTSGVSVTVASPTTGNANIAINVVGFNPFLLSGM
jgi:hypothetical protein